MDGNTSDFCFSVVVEAGSNVDGTPSRGSDGGEDCFDDFKALETPPKENGVDDSFLIGAGAAEPKEKGVLRADVSAAGEGVVVGVSEGALACSVLKASAAADCCSVDVDASASLSSPAGFAVGVVSGWLRSCSALLATADVSSSSPRDSPASVTSPRSSSSDSSSDGPTSDSASSDSSADSFSY